MGKKLSATKHPQKRKEFILFRYTIFKLNTQNFTGRISSVFWAVDFLNPISTGLFCLVVALGEGGVFHPPP